MKKFFAYLRLPVQDRRMQVVVRHVFVSPGHNFFGHHGRAAGRHPIESMQSVVCHAGRGIEGDRFYDYRADYRGQITFFDFRVYEEIKRALEVPELTPEVFRRNVLIEGLDLPALIGARFSLGNVEFEGASESTPCYWMNDAVAPGAEQWLKGRGGLRAKILTDGDLAVGPVPFTLQRGQLSMM